MGRILEDNPKIDFVIPWVDGNDPNHIASRNFYAAGHPVTKAIDIEQSIGSQRFESEDELKYCLRSIVNNAPWYNKIWLITDDQVPVFLDQEKLAVDRIEIIDHKTLFRGFEKYLPTFNTRSILTNVDKIPGLSQHFIIGNDDIFFARKVTSDFFLSNKGMKVYCDVIKRTDVPVSSIHYKGVLRSSNMINPASDELLLLSHGFTILDKATIAELRIRYANDFDENLKFRFRHESQFLIESLICNHHLVNQSADFMTTEQMIHFSFQLCREGTPEKLAFLFSLLESGKRSMFCLNDFVALKKRCEWVTEKLELLCGKPLRSEHNAN